MSNPAVYLLAENNIHGNHLRIEDNLGEAIHIHFGDIRASLTIGEFNSLYESVLVAVKELLRLQGIDFTILDSTSFDWNWLENYEGIESISQRDTRIGDLYTSYRIKNREQFSKIVNIKDSPFVAALRGDERYLKTYKEANCFGQDSVSRLKDVKKVIDEKGYPFDDKLIMADTNGLIYDGDHRAACLYEKYGEQYVIPILELKHKETMPPLKEVILHNRRVLYARLLKKYVKDVLKILIDIPRRILKETSTGGRQTSVASEIVVPDTIEQVIAWLNEQNMDYYVIRHNGIRFGERFEVEIIIDDYDKLKEISGFKYKEAYPEYIMLYSTPHPIRIETKSGTLIVWDRPCVKSRFEDDFLPLDKYCNQFIKNTIVKVGDERRIGIIGLTLYIITRALLENLAFTAEDIEVIEKNAEYLRNRELYLLLEKEFFKFTDRLLDLLNKGEYEASITEYVRFTGY